MKALRARIAPELDSYTFGTGALSSTILNYLELMENAPGFGNNTTTGALSSIQKAHGKFPQASGFVSRATMVIKANVISSDIACPSSIVKPSWVNKDRKNEYDPLGIVCAFSGDFSNRVSCASGFPSTGQDTEMIDIRNRPPQLAQVRCAVTLGKLEPLTCLRGEDLLTAWVHIVRRHFALWKIDIFHQDPNINNLMAQGNGNTVLGILIDWDLSYTGDKQADNNDPTGTIPFMAIRVLQEKSKKRPFQQLYYHDLESLIWVLLWVLLFVDKGIEEHKSTLLLSILTPNISDCYWHKLDLLNEVVTQHQKPKPEWNNLWPVGHALAKWVDRVKLEDHPVDSVVFDSLMEIVEHWKPAGYVMPAIPSVL